MSALSRAHVLVLVDTAKEFDAAICYGAAQEQEAVLVPNTDPHRRSLDPQVDIQVPFRVSHFRTFVHPVGRQFLGAKSAACTT